MVSPLELADDAIGSMRSRIDKQKKQILQANLILSMWLKYGDTFGWDINDDALDALFVETDKYLEKYVL